MKTIEHSEETSAWLRLYINMAAQISRDAHFISKQVATFNIAIQYYELVDQIDMGGQYATDFHLGGLEDSKLSRKELLQAMSICSENIGQCSALDDDKFFARLADSPNACNFLEEIQACHEMILMMHEIRSKMRLLHANYQLSFDNGSHDPQFTYHGSSMTQILQFLVRLRDAGRRIVTTKIEAYLIIERAMRKTSH